MDTPRSVLKGAALVVEVLLTQNGYAGETVSVQVEDEGRIVADQAVTLPADGEPATVRGRFTASASNAKGDKKAIEALEKKANVITERAKGWVYELSAGEGEKLTTKIEDILEKPKAS